MIPILDAGHGGIINGHYQTSGKRSPNWTKGILYEGAFNRWVAWRLMEELDRRGKGYFHVSPELRDVGLKTRVKRINKIHKHNDNVYLLSIHANAGRGNGMEAYTSIGETKSDPIAEYFIEELEKIGYVRKDLTDGDKDKEAGFYLLRKTTCPAVLVECGFMDGDADYYRLWDRTYISNIVNSLANVICKI